MAEIRNDPFAAHAFQFGEIGVAQVAGEIVVDGGMTARCD